MAQTLSTDAVLRRVLALLFLVSLSAAVLSVVPGGGNAWAQDAGDPESALGPDEGELSFLYTGGSMDEPERRHFGVQPEQEEWLPFTVVPVLAVSEPAGPGHTVGYLWRVYNAKVSADTGNILFAIGPFAVTREPWLDIEVNGADPGVKQVKAEMFAVEPGDIDPATGTRLLGIKPAKKGKTKVYIGDGTTPLTPGDIGFIEVTASPAVIAAGDSTSLTLRLLTPERQLDPANGVPLTLVAPFIAGPYSSTAGTAAVPYTPAINGLLPLAGAAPDYTPDDPNALAVVAVEDLCPDRGKQGRTVQVQTPSGETVPLTYWYITRDPDRPELTVTAKPSVALPDSDLPPGWSLRKGEDGLTLPTDDSPQGECRSVAVIDASVTGEHLLIARSGTSSRRICIVVTDDYIDLDVDSDNDNGFDPPERDDHEDELEGRPSARPKIAEANFNDDDGDDLPDYADGYNLFGDDSADDENGAERFYPVVLALAPGIDPSTAVVRLTYRDSNPLAVERVGEPGAYAYVLPPGGRFRLWTLPGDEPRSGAPVTGTGHFIPSEAEIPAPVLGFAPGVTSVTVYLEAVQFAYTESDRRILMEVFNTPGAAAEYAYEDEVFVGDEAELWVTGPEGLTDRWDGQGPLEIPADYVGQAMNDFIGLGADFTARLGNRSEFLSLEPMEDRQVTWTVFYTGKGTPTMQDAVNGVSGQDTLDAVVRRGYSHIFLQYLHEVDGEQRVNAGDRFTLRADFTPTGEQRAQGMVDLRAEMQCVIVPGQKALHVALDADAPDYVNLRNEAHRVAEMSRAEFEQTFRGTTIAAPTGSTEQKLFELYLFDRFRNPMPAGTEISWSLVGGGALGEGREEDPGTFLGVQQRNADTVRNDHGMAQILFTQGQYPACPWDTPPDEAWLSTGVVLAAGAARLDAGASAVSTDYPDPQPLPEIKLTTVEGGGGCADGTSNPPPGPVLDLHTRDTLTVKVRAVLRFGPNDSRPIVGADLQAFCTNGRFDNQGVERTDADGVATFTLRGERAHVGEFRCMVTLGSTPLQVNCGQWVSSAPVYLVADHYGLVRDRDADGILKAETLIPNGMPFPGRPGVYCRDQPYYHETCVTLYGQPDHEYFVGVRGFEALGPSIHLPFDTEANHITPDIVQDADGVISGGAIDLADSARGLSAIDGSLRIEPGDRVTVGAGSVAEQVLELADGLLMSFYVKPDDLTGGVLMDKPGQYRVEMLGDGTGRLQLTAFYQGGHSVSVVTDVGLAEDDWNLVRLEVQSSILVLMVGPGEDELDGAFQKGDAQLAVPGPGTGPLTLGGGIAGRIDDFRASRKTVAGPRDQILDLDGNETNTVTTDSTGIAKFIFRVRYLPEGTGHIVMNHVIEATGSRRAETTVVSMGEKLWGTLTSCADAVGQCVSDGIGWSLAQTEGLGLEYVPFVGDIRELIKEIYKGSTGCDEVSKLNVGFAVAGLVIDTTALVLAIPSGGASVAAGMGAKVALKAGLKAVALWAIKETLINFAASQVIKGTCQLAVAAYVRSIQLHASLIDDPPPWYASAEQLFAGMEAWANQNTTARGMNSAFKSVGDMVDMSSILENIGPQRTEAMLTQIGEIE